jgi:hypothetical protein
VTNCIVSRTNDESHRMSAVFEFFVSLPLLESVPSSLRQQRSRLGLTFELTRWQLERALIRASTCEKLARPYLARCPGSCPATQSCNFPLLDVVFRLGLIEDLP